MIHFHLQQNSAWQQIRRWRWPLALSLAFCASANAQTGFSVCGDITNHFGPYDYRNHAGSVDFKTNKNNPLYLVESTHFRPEMEALVRGREGGEVGPELDYTLRAFPNHHKALDAMVRLSEKLKMDPPRFVRYSVDCWFVRAIRFRPDDTIVRMIYATYLGKRKRVPDALSQLEIVASAAKDNPFTHYNIGLIYLDLNVFDRALAEAHISYELGMQRTELRDKLTSSGHWREPVVAPLAPASAPASSQ